MMLMGEGCYFKGLVKGICEGGAIKLVWSWGGEIVSLAGAVREYEIIYWSE